LKFRRAPDSALELKMDARSRIIAVIRADACPSALRERISIRASALQLVPQAPVEVVAPTRAAPKWETPLGEHVIDELRDGAMDGAHNLS
jgi:hypothetical protein